jgi:formate/nitrite transporter FocA (FNT family)
MSSVARVRKRAGAPPSEDVTPQVEEAFERGVGEGAHRLDRSLASLLATGIVGALDVGVGVFAMLIVRQATGSKLLSALAFAIGFIALTLAGSELFTENFLIPIMAVVTIRRHGALSLVRLWVGTLIANVIAGFGFMFVVLTAYPSFKGVVREIGRVYPSMGISRVSLCSALLAGMVMTLMTWMERSTTSMPAKLIAASTVAFLLIAAPLDHAIVGSLEMSGALIAGAPFGYARAFATIGWAVLWNAVGGIGLVTVLRLIQVGKEKIEDVRRREAS